MFSIALQMQPRMFAAGFQTTMSVSGGLARVEALRAAQATAIAKLSMRSAL
jgi:hypothetical protein